LFCIFPKGVTMAFEISSEQEMIRLMARDFAKKELEPMAAEWDRQGIFPIEAIKKMGELGLLGMMVPPALGGSGAARDSLRVCFECRHHVGGQPVHRAAS
jgi:alkylation response protein AidB-like acyl-CoA dehydrogenase